MVRRVTLLRVTDQTGAWLLTVAANALLVGSVCEVEVVDLSAQNTFFVAFLDAVRPHRTVDVDKLIRLEGY